MALLLNNSDKSSSFSYFGKQSIKQRILRMLPVDV